MAKPEKPEKPKIPTHNFTDNFITGQRQVKARENFSPVKRGERRYFRSKAHQYTLLCVTGTLAKDGLSYASFLYGSRRFPGSSSPTRRELGMWPNMTIAEAHEKAQHWDKLIGQGVDPADERVRLVEEAKKAKHAKEGRAFSIVAENYLKFAGKQRQVKEVRRIIEKELLPAFDSRPIDEIASTEGKALIVSIADRSPSMARNVLTVCKSLFAWDLDERSPFSSIRPEKIIGEKKPRQRLLSDAEFRAFWRAAEKLPYPYGPLYRFLALTGVRLREAADAKWSEIDLATRTWTIPPERFKSECYHFVRLADPALRLLKALPVFEGHEDGCVFSYTGSSPVNSFSKSKERLDALMAEELGGPVTPWVIHDLRRLVRSKLAKLKVSDIVAELILGHGKKGVQRIYDLEGREDDMLAAMKEWAKLLDKIVTAAPAKITKMRKTA